MAADSGEGMDVAVNSQALPACSVAFGKFREGPWARQYRHWHLGISTNGYGHAPLASAIHNPHDVHQTPWLTQFLLFLQACFYSFW